MAGDLELKVRIGAELKELKAALGDVKKELVNLNKTAKDAGKGAESGFDRVGASVKSLKSQVLGLVAAYASLQTVKGFISLADDYQQVNARLKLVTKSTEEFERAQKGIYQIAQESRQPIGEVTDLYAKLARSTESLGVSQTALLRVTDTINKAITLSGSSSESAAAALIQLGQGIASGTLRGEELNSVLEQTPRLAQALAEGMGVTVGELRKLGQEGQITSGKVIEALIKQGEVIDQEFGQMPKTVGGAIQQLKNDFEKLAGSSNLQPLVKAFDDLRTTINDPAVQEGVVNLFAGIINGASKAAEIVAGLNYLINGSSDEYLKLDDQVIDLNKDIEYYKNQLEGIRLLRIDATDDVSFFASDEELNGKIAELTAKREDLLKQMDAVLNKRSKQAEQAKRISDEEKKALDAEAENLKQRSEDEAKRKAAADEAEKLEKKRLQNIQDILTALEKEAATTGKTAADIAQYELSQLGATKADKERAAQLSITIEELKKKADAEKKAQKDAEDWANRQKEIVKEMAAVENELASLTGNDAQKLASSRAQFTAQYQKLLDDLKRKNDQAGIDLVNRLINVEVAEQRVNQIEDKVGKALERLRNTEQSVDVKVQTGEINQPGAQQQLQGARAQALADLQALRAELAALASENAPGAADALRTVDEEINRIGEDSINGAERAIRSLRAELANLQENFTGDGIVALRDSLTGFFEDIAINGESAGDALKNFAVSFVTSMARIAAQALATYAVLQLLDAVYPGLGRTTAAGMSAGVNHSGGVVGQTAMRRNVNPLVFAAAPRYHTGGVAGLKPGEVPAILQQGEEVLTKSDPRNVQNGGAQSGGGTRVINVIDPNMMQDYMNSSQGEKVIVNMIQRNSGAIKQVLA